MSVAVQLPFRQCPVDSGSSYIIVRHSAWQPGAAVSMRVKPLDLEVACTSKRGQVVWQLSYLLRAAAAVLGVST